MQLLLITSAILTHQLAWSQNLEQNIQNVFGTPPGASSSTTKDPFLDIFSTLMSKTNFSDATSGSKCRRPDDGVEGVCVWYYQCDKVSKQIITDGGTLLDERMSQVCPKYFEVCCQLPDVDLNAPKPTALPTPLPTKPTTSEPTAVPSSTPTRVKPPSSSTPTSAGAASKCGFSNQGDVFRERGQENTAEFLEFPWVVAMLKRTAPSGAWSRSDYVGGGTLIHPQVVLTAAHKVFRIKADNHFCLLGDYVDDAYVDVKGCVREIENEELQEKLKVRAGEFNTETQSEVYKHQEQDVRLIVRHKNYYKPSVLNSIALLFLEAPFLLTGAPNVGIACLGRQMPSQGTRCFGVGWGRVNMHDENSYAAKLKKIEVPIVGRQTCENAMRGTRLGSYFQLHESLTCAGGEGDKDTCQGDGGSPLICAIGEPKDARFAVFAAVAYGIGCGVPGVPGVYVNLPHFHSWITDHMREQGYDDSSYTI